MECPFVRLWIRHYLSLTNAFKGKEAPFDSTIFGLLTDWLMKEGVTHED